MTRSNPDETTVSQLAVSDAAAAAGLSAAAVAATAAGAAPAAEPAPAGAISGLTLDPIYYTVYSIQIYMYIIHH